MDHMPKPPADLADFIVAEVHRQTTSDNIRSLVEKRIGEVIASSVESAFRSWGDVGKQIEKAVTASLQIGDRVDVPAYGNMVMAMLRAKMDERLHELVSGRLAEEMNEILNLAPKELKLSDVVKEMMDDIDKDDRYGTSATCIIEKSDSARGYYRIYLDTDEDVRKHECELQFALDSEGKIYSLTCDGKDAKTTIVMGGMWGFRKTVFAAYCCGSKVIIDDLHPSVSIGDF